MIHVVGYTHIKEALKKSLNYTVKKKKKSKYDIIKL